MTSRVTYNKTPVVDIEANPSVQTQNVPTQNVPTEINLKYYLGFGCLFLTIVLIVCTTVPLSFHYINYDEYSLEQNVYGDVNIDKVYTKGRVFKTLNYKFIKFPSTYQKIIFDSTVFSENGLEFILTATTQYRLPINNLGKIYNTYSTNYDSRVLNTAKQIVKNTASSFSVNSFLKNRTIIETTIGENMEIGLNMSVKVESPSRFFKITNVIFPDSIIETSLDTAISLQNNQIQIFQQNVDVIISDTDKMVSQILTNKNRLLEFSLNAASLFISNSKSKAAQITDNARSKGISYVCNLLNITDTILKSELIKVLAIIDNNSNLTMLNGLGNVLISV